MERGGGRKKQGKINGRCGLSEMYGQIVEERDWKAKGFVYEARVGNILFGLGLGGCLCRMSLLVLSL